MLYPINTRILCAAMFAFPRYRQCLLFDVCKVASTIRARFAQVTQNPLCVFSLLGNLDGDSASPFPRFLTQQAVFFGFYIEYSRSVMVPITRKDKTWQDQKSKRNWNETITSCSVSTIRNMVLSHKMPKQQICLWRNMHVNKWWTSVLQWNMR